MVTHNELSSQWFMLSKSAGLSGKLEPLLDRSASGRRADLILYKPDFQYCKEIKEFTNFTSNVDILFDVKVGFPCAASYIAKGSHKEPGVAANDGFTKKMTKYHDSPDNLLQGRYQHRIIRSLSFNCEASACPALFQGCDSIWSPKISSCKLLV